MPTRNFVPRADGEGMLGTSEKQWNTVNAKVLKIDGVDIIELFTNGDKALIPQIVHGAALHNELPRGADLTEYFTSGEMSLAISNGTFKNIYIGDYITRDITIGENTYTIKWVVAHLDYFLHGDNIDTAEHHVVLIADEIIPLTEGVNETATAEGGYLGTKLWKELIPQLDTEIANVFGETHVLTHSEKLSNAINAETGKASAAEWVNVKTNIPSEPMVFGTSVFGNGLDVGNKERQLAYFKQTKYSQNRKWFWLQTVASATSFAQAGKDGDVLSGEANAIDADGGLRPYFLLV